MRRHLPRMVCALTLSNTEMSLDRIAQFQLPLCPYAILTGKSRSDLLTLSPQGNTGCVSLLSVRRIQQEPAASVWTQSHHCQLLRTQRQARPSHRAQKRVTVFHLPREQKYFT